MLQVVFGWQDYHLYRFTSGPQDDPGAAFACTADLAEAFDDERAVPTWDVRVDELLAAVGERLHYQYDYGDNWWLAIEVEDTVDGPIPPARAVLLEGGWRRTARGLRRHPRLPPARGRSRPHPPGSPAVTRRGGGVAGTGGRP